MTSHNFLPAIHSVYPHVLSCTCVFTVTAMHAEVCVACGGEDVIPVVLNRGGASGNFQGERAFTCSTTGGLKLKLLRGPHEGL